MTAAQQSELAELNFRRWCYARRKAAKQLIADKVVEFRRSERGICHIYLKDCYINTLLPSNGRFHNYDIVTQFWATLAALGVLKYSPEYVTSSQFL